MNLKTSIRRFVFARRGSLLALPALALGTFGRPTIGSMVVGLPFAFLGEAIRVWAVGYAGTTTRSSAVEAPALVTAGPYAYVRNPLYVGNVVTATGFAFAFTGGNSARTRFAIMVLGLGTMVSVYACIVPHEETFLRSTFGQAYDDYVARVPRVFPALEPARYGVGKYDPSVIGKAESRTFVTFGCMLAWLVLQARRTENL